METLLEKMDEYWKRDTLDVDPTTGRKFFRDDTDDQTGELIGLLWEHLFIGSYWNTNTKMELEKHGYHCWIGDGDSFGILIACISKDGKTFTIG